MRIIPKRTKVRMELFKGIELVDVLVAGAGMGLSASFLVSNLPAHLALSIVTLIITVGLVVPIEDDKGYILIYNVLKYAGRYKIFYKRSAKEAVFKEAASREKQEDTGKKNGAISLGLKASIMLQRRKRSMQMQVIPQLNITKCHMERVSWH